MPNAHRSYDAHAGVGDLPNGRSVEVFYMDKAACLEAFGRQGWSMPKRRNVGWYWRYHGAAAASAIGPATSSRAALKDAIVKNQGR